MKSKSQHDSPELDHLEATKQYFIRVDAGRADTVDLFTEDAQIYFPKFGIARGKAAFGELASGLFKRVSKLSHDLSTFTYVVTPDVIVVEGKTQGMDVEGRRWSGGETPGGRFCSVFVLVEIRNHNIRALPREGNGDGTSDSRIASGDQRGFAE